MRGGANLQSLNDVSVEVQVWRWCWSAMLI